MSRTPSKYIQGFIDPKELSLEKEPYPKGIQVAWCLSTLYKGLPKLYVQ